jgi:hypothetical protein
MQKTIPQGLNRLRKNPEEQGEVSKNIPQGLKPAVYYQQLTARLKSCPFKTPHHHRLSRYVCPGCHCFHVFEAIVAIGVLDR